MKSFRPAFFLFLAVLYLTTSYGYAADKQTAQVEEVLTGESVRLVGGKTLRYIGIQAPPLQSIVPLVRQYGAESLAFNKELVDGKRIVIEWGSQIWDSQRNLLGYVFLEDGTFVNQEILREGHAKIRLAPPNLKHAAAFRKAELDAHRNKRGQWREEPDNPFLKSEYIGEKNTKTYYFPDSPELERIPQANLVTFRSRVEAKAAGYRPCATCSEESATAAEL